MPTPSSVTEISPEELKLQLDSPQPPLVLDVREPWELEAARLGGTLDIPMAQVPQRLAELPRDRPIVVMCHAGARSMKVANFLVQNGFEQVASLDGGIRAWAEDVDPSVGTY